MEKKGETKINWITCPECGSKIGLIVSLGKPTIVSERQQSEISIISSAASITEKLSTLGVDLSLIEIEERDDLIVITPRRFLGDLWGQINEMLKTLGAVWIREGKQSRWEIHK
ncbi:MAG: hypothetical protein ACPL07_03315 [Candidatus Bathyarchaeia archaeon]